MGNPNLVRTVNSVPTHTPTTNTEKSVIYRLKNETTGWVWDYNDNVWTEFNFDLAPPYKVYTALLTQSGTNAPVATVLENTLGGTVVWSYQSTGLYRATLTGAFTLNKTVSNISPSIIVESGINTRVISMIPNDEGGIDDMILYSNDHESGTNLQMNGLITIEIRVYN